MIKLQINSNSCSRNRKVRQRSQPLPESSGGAAGLDDALLDDSRKFCSRKEED